MGILSDFEDRLARAVEGAFAGAFRSPVQPAELARALAHAMDDGRVVGVGKVYAPSSYTIELSPDDARTLGQTFEGVLASELETYLLDHARKRDYTLANAPAIEFDTARDLRIGRFRIGTEMASAPEGPEAEAAGDKVGAAAGLPRASSSEEPVVMPVAQVVAAGTQTSEAADAPPASGKVSPRVPAAEHAAQAQAAPEPAAAPEGPALFDREAPEPAAPEAEPSATTPTPSGGTAAAAAAVAATSASAPALAPRTLATVTVGENGHDVALQGERLVAGRLAECAITLEDRNVSRRHTAFVAVPGGWAVEDLDSTNGTWVNGQRAQRQTLSDGDVVTIGATRLIYHAGR
jgi:hypothetical protein